jgi:hypothetical protein
LLDGVLTTSLESEVCWRVNIESNDNLLDQVVRYVSFAVGPTKRQGDISSCYQRVDAEDCNVAMQYTVVVPCGAMIIVLCIEARRIIEQVGRVSAANL